MTIVGHHTVWLQPLKGQKCFVFVNFPTKGGGAGSSGESRNSSQCHCCCKRESPRAHVTKLNCRLMLIRKVLRASKISDLKLIEIVILWVYYTISFVSSLLWHFSSITFHLLKLLCLTKNHWRGLSVRHAHIVGTLIAPWVLARAQALLL